MRCQEFKRLQGELYDGSAPREIEDELVQHMAQCKGCSLEYARFSRAMMALRADPIEDPPQNLWELYQAYAAQKEEERRLGLAGRMAKGISKWRSDVCEGIIIFISVAAANLCRKLERYVAEYN